MPRRTEDFLEGELTSDIIGAMYETHQELGFGYRELIYSRALEVLLTETGHRVDREVAVTVYFRGVALATQVMDMIVDDKVLVEIKTTERLHPAGTSQLPLRDDTPGWALAAFRPRSKSTSRDL